MSLMFLLNPPEKKSHYLSLKYPRKLGLPAKKRARPSKTLGRSHIRRMVAEELGLKKGERPLKHRLTFWRHPKADPKKLKSVLRSPLAVLRNARKRKGVKIMARRRRRSHRRNPIANRKRRSHRRNPIANRKRRSHRRGKIRAIVLANPKRRHVRRYHRNSPLGILANPKLALKEALAPIGQAAGIFGGYFVTRTATNYLWTFGLSKVAFLNNNKKWAEPISQAAVAFGLSYVVNKFVKKPAIAKAVLIGGLFSAVKALVANLTETVTLPPEIKSALGGFTPEEQMGSDVYGGYTEEQEEVLSDVSEEGPDRYKPRY